MTNWDTSVYILWGLIIAAVFILIIRNALIKKFCPNCGHVGPVRHFSVGSFWLEIFLWGTGFITLLFGIGILILVAAIFYSGWRFFVTKPGCQLCGYENLAPLDSPVALRALQKQELE